MECLISIELVGKPDETWTINKRYSDFEKLSALLKSKLKVNVLPLPNKNKS